MPIFVVAMTKDTRTQWNPSVTERLRSALDQLTGAWAPVNSKILRDLKELAGSKGAVSDEVTQKLLQEAKRDLPLFMFLAKQSAPFEAGKEDIADDFVSQMLKSPTALSETIRLVDERGISNHNFHAMERVQAQSIKHGLVACTAAQTLALKAGLDGDAAFSASAMRQFSLNLLAWNFPRIYSSSLQGASKMKESLEASLGRTLGYNPRTFAARFSQQYNISNVTRDIVAKTGPTPLDAVSIASVCEAGELFAALYTPELGSGARKRLRELNDHVDRVVGPEGFRILHAQCKESLNVYSELDPHEFNVSEQAIGLASTKQSSTVGWHHLLSENTYVGKCPQDIQELFRAVYKYVKPNGASPEAVQILASLLIPRAGFTQGCVFLADDDTYALSPKLRIGPAPLTRYRVRSPENATAATILSESFFCTFPVRERNSYMFGELVSYVCCAFGKNQRSGVLYLEMTDARGDRPDDETLLIVKAIRHCLNDCLAVSL